MSSGSIDDEPPYPFRPLTKESLIAIQRRIDEDKQKQKEQKQKRKLSEKEDEEPKDEEEEPKPNPALDPGNILPIRLATAFDLDLAGQPLEDLDPYFDKIPTFVIITQKKEIFRFSASNAMFLLSPFNPIRRIALTILLHPFFSLCIITTILVNCWVMIMPSSPITEATEVPFTAIYTFESGIKLISRGFILSPYTYLRDAWNWLDFLVIALAYVTMAIDLGNLSSLKTFRVFRVMKIVALVPGLKSIVGAIAESVKNLRDVIILTLFSLMVFGLIGLQIYMGVLTQKCIRNFPEDGSAGDLNDYNWYQFNMNSTNWQLNEDNPELDPPLCGNTTGAGQCEENYTCLMGFGRNPDYGYTSFDSFGWAFLAAFRLMTQDFWENIYQQVLRVSGPWHMIFFIVNIFYSSFYLVNLILAIVAMSYDELQAAAEQEALLEAAELEAMKAEDAAKEAVRVGKEEAAATAAGEKNKENNSNNNEDDEDGASNTLDLPTYGSFVSYDLWNDGYQVQIDSTNNVLRRKNSRAEENAKKHRSYNNPSSSKNESLDFIPYVDDSTRMTPLKEGFMTASAGKLASSQNLRDSYIQSVYTSYDSHMSKCSYNSHLGNFGVLNQKNIPVEEESLLNKNTEQPIDESHSQSSSKCEIDDLKELKKLINQAATEDPDEDENKLINQIKRLIKAGCLRCLDMFCVWDCGVPWSIFQNLIAFIVFDPFMELFITCLIMVNTVFMALDHYGLEENISMANTLKTGNTVFSTIFALEALFKIIAMSPKFYFKEGWNAFDSFIVTVSLIEMIFEDANLPGMSAMRSFRLLRVFKLAKSWPTLNLIMTVMGKTVGALGNLVVVLVIIIFIFAVMGMQLFAQSYVDNVDRFPTKELPRWNFKDFGHAFMIIFRVLCGEWIESMWDCMLVVDASCVPYFLAVVIIGNLVALNLFLALLLSSFSGLEPPSADGDADSNKLAEAFNRIDRFIKWTKSLIRLLLLSIKIQIFGLFKSKDEPVVVTKPGEKPPPNLAEVKGKFAEKAKLLIHTNKVIINTNLKEMDERLDFGMSKEEKEEPEEIQRDLDSDSMASYTSHPTYLRQNEDVTQEEPELEDTVDPDNEGEEEAEDLDNLPNPEEEPDGPAPCFPPGFYVKFPYFAQDDTPMMIVWANIRLKTFRLIEDKYFETVVITLILVSSLALAVEDVHLHKKPMVIDILYYMDKIFTVIFFIEMLIKWLAFGFHQYFKNAWCWLDFLIVMVSLVDFIAPLLGFGGLEILKTLKTLRALRPLRALSRMEGMRMVVNALFQSIPSIVNVLLVCLIFWLIFAIMGVQLFNGKYFKCIDPSDESRPDYRVIKDKFECLAQNFSWENSNMNFDHVAKAYLSLFMVATFKGWIQIMNDGIDMRGQDEQPHREDSFVMYVYFVIFIIFGSFFTLNLFIGVIIDNFNEQKKKAGDPLEMLMTDDQKKYYSAMKKMKSKKPLKAIPRPKWKPQAMVFNLITDKKFDMLIMGFIGANMVVMTLDHANMTENWKITLDILNAIFIALFSTESVLKIFALRHHYFVNPWNLFDLFVGILSIFGLVLSDLIEKYFVSPTLLRVARVAKIGRVLRLIKGAKGIRTLLFSLAMSLPALFNICLLLFLVMFIFSIFGMSFFMNVKLRGALDEVYNFQTFGQSIILLFQMSTSAGWDGVLEGVMDEEDCDLPNPEMGFPGNCGNPTTGIAFILAYLVLTFLIIVNMYIAVILENYSQATEEVQEGLTEEDYDMYYETWSMFDPEGTHFIELEKLSDFLDILEDPMQIKKPNKFKVIVMDIPICKDDKMYCVDILDALTKNFFASKGKDINEISEGIDEMDRSESVSDYVQISSTLFRNREEHCARLIQRAWRSRGDGPGPTKLEAIVQKAHRPTTLNVPVSNYLETVDESFSFENTTDYESIGMGRPSPVFATKITQV